MVALDYKLINYDENNSNKDICFSENYATLKNDITVKMIVDSIKNKTSDCLGNWWIRFLPNKFSILINDADGVRNGGLEVQTNNIK